MPKFIEGNVTIDKVSSHFNDDFINHELRDGLIYDYIKIYTNGLNPHDTRELFIKIKKYEEHHDISVKFDKMHIIVRYKEKEEND